MQPTEDPTTAPTTPSLRTPARQTADQPSAAMRWLGIAARTSHIGAAALLFGGLLLATPFVRLTPWHHLTIATGGFLLLLEWRHDPRWPHRGKGLLALLHIGLCLLIHWTPALTAPLLWLILISGSVGSHMPRKFRHWSSLQGWEIRDR